MVTLEEQLSAAFVELIISQNNQDAINSYLTLLRLKDTDTYEHSIRVGLLGTKVATHMHLEPKALFFAGLMHDIGKVMVDEHLLRKNGAFSKKDRQAMKNHVKYGYELLKDVYPFSAEIALRHHRHQEKGYPKRLPKPCINFSYNTRMMIEFFARILSLVDFYDALTTRADNEAGKKLNYDEAKAIMLMKNLDQKHLIEDLYNNQIFGEDAEKPATPTQDLLYESIWKDWDGRRNPRETRRYVTLACALEPLPEKAGCTTRQSDVSRHLKLEYFITGAVNIGDAFEDLATRVLDEGKQPELIYDTAYKAQLECSKNRSGGRINQGMLEMLIPIVTSQLLYDPDYKASVSDVLEKAKQVMQNTSQKDVQELIKMKRLAYDLSAYHDRQVMEYPEAKTVYDYYASDLKNSNSQTSIKHNEEFVLGFPTIRRIYELIIGSERRRFNRKVEEAYAIARKEYHTRAGAGLTADCVACAIHLVLSHHPKDKIIK